MRNNKKKIIVCMVLLGIAAGLAAWFILRPAKKQDYVITDFYPNKLSDLEAVTIMSGNTGNIVTITDRADWERIVESLNGLEFRLMKIKAKDERGGWGYQLCMKTVDRELYMTFAGDRCSIDRKTYQISDGTELTETERLLGELFERQQAQESK